MRREEEFSTDVSQSRGGKRGRLLPTPADSSSRDCLSSVTISRSSSHALLLPLFHSPYYDSHYYDETQRVLPSLRYSSIREAKGISSPSGAFILTTVGWQASLRHPSLTSRA